MGLETGNFIEDLDLNWPVSGDFVLQGDDHIRLIKKVLKQQFPGSSGQGLSSSVDLTEAEFNSLIGASSNIQAQLNILSAAVAANGSIPINGVIMYNGLFSNIATNFQLCDGTNGTPDLTDKFVYGTNTEFELNDTGGSADSTLPAHIHSSTHDHPLVNTSSVNIKEANPGQVFITGGGAGFLWDGTQGNIPHTHTLDIAPLTHDVDSSGVSPVGTNIPNFIKLAFIIRMT